jgi:hypothetical protein
MYSSSREARIAACRSPYTCTAGWLASPRCYFSVGKEIKTTNNNNKAAMQADWPLCFGLNKS